MSRRRSAAAATSPGPPPSVTESRLVVHDAAQAARTFSEVGGAAVREAPHRAVGGMSRRLGRGQQQKVIGLSNSTIPVAERVTLRGDRQGRRRGGAAVPVARRGRRAPGCGAAGEPAAERLTRMIRSVASAWCRTSSRARASALRLRRSSVGRILQKKTVSTVREARGMNAPCPTTRWESSAGCVQPASEVPSRRSSASSPRTVQPTSRSAESRRESGGGVVPRRGTHSAQAGSTCPRRRWSGTSPPQSRSR